MDESKLKEKMASGLIWSFAERICAQMVSALVSIILARILFPEDYAPISIITVIITLCNVVVVNGMGTSLVQKKDAEIEDFSTVFYLGLIINSVIYIAFFFAAPYIADVYKMPVLIPIIRVMGIRLIISAINSVQRAYVSNTMQFKRFFWSTLFGTIVSGVVGIIMAYMGFGVWALVMQYLTNTIVDTIVLLFTISWRPAFYFSIKRAKPLFSYAWKISASALMDELYNSIRTLSIGKVYSAEQLSFYNRAEYYPNLLTKNIISSVNSVIFPAFSKIQDDREKIKSVLKESIKVGSYLTTPILLGFTVIAQRFVHLVLTDKWLPMVPYMRLISIALCVSPLSAVHAQVIKALGRSDVLLIQQIIKKVLGILIIIWTVTISVDAVVIGVAVFEFLCYGINAYPNRKLINYFFSEQIKDVWKNYSISIIMMFSVMIPEKFLQGGNDVAILIVQVVIGIVVYVLLSVITKNESFNLLLRMLKQKNEKD